MGNAYAMIDSWFFGMMFLLAMASVTLVGVVVAICGWAGARAGMAVSALVALLGFVGIGVLWLMAYWLCWLCVPAIYFGWLGFRSWRRRADTVGRQPFHFSLSGMMLFVLVVALIVGGNTIAERGLQAENLLITQLERHQGSYVYQESFGRASSVIIAPTDEAELREIVTILKQLTQLHRVQLNGSANLPTAKTIELTSELTSLRELSMQDVAVNDTDLAPLGKLKNLELLELNARVLSDTGLPNLYPLKRMRQMWLYNADPQLVTPAGMRKLRNALPDWEN